MVFLIVTTGLAVIFVKSVSNNTFNPQRLLTFIKGNMKTREIKFRDYDMDSKELRYFDLDGYDRENHDCYGNVMQYTGIQDSEGIDIYEGDIVEFPEYYETPEMTSTNWETGKIVFVHGAFHIKSKNQEITPDTYNLCYEYQCYDGRIRVVGNIYENPDLL